MKRIKKGLLKSGFVVHLPTKEMVRTVLICLKNTKEYSDLTMSSDIWDWYKSETVLDINNFQENEVYYGSTVNEEFILSYDEIWEVTGGYIDPEYYVNTKICGAGLNRNGVIYESDVLERAVKRENTKKYERMDRASAVSESLVKIFEDNLIMNPRRNGKSLQSINNLIDYIDYMTIKNQFKNKVRGISANNIYIDCNWGNIEEKEEMTKRSKIRGLGIADELFIDEAWDINEEEQMMTKIEIKVEELEKVLQEDENLLSELKVANKHVDVSYEITTLKNTINDTKQLLKGYETLDDMYIANVIVNNNTVIVIALDGEKAVSKLSDDDDFNFLAGFFMNLVKLDSSVDNYWYDYSIHVALEDIQNGNL